MDISADAQLARTLQDEEYQVGISNAKVTKSRKSVVKNFMDESDGLSSLLSDDSVILSRQMIKSAARISLPTRAARDSAKKSIARRQCHFGYRGV
jgi:TfoX/Sxy family transcriptional regulator of competence genes